MGLFDMVKCEYPLGVDGANEAHYQTKDTPEQCFETYKIDKDGQLWFLHCDYEWINHEVLKSVKKKWIIVSDFTGEVFLTGHLEREVGQSGEYGTLYFDWCFDLVKGKVKSVKRLGKW